MNPFNEEVSVFVSIPSSLTKDGVALIIESPLKEGCSSLIPSKRLKSSNSPTHGAAYSIFFFLKRFNAEN